jgi:F-type H+-transporting ATPase subunit epsilon
MAETTTNPSDLKLVVVTPEATIVDVTAEFVALPLYDGEIGIGRNHAPMIGRLGFGELRYRFAGDTGKYYVDGGFVQVQDNRVSVLTNRALTTDKLDATAAKIQLEQALTRSTSNPEEMAIRERLILQARAQIRLADKTSE